MKHVIFSGHAIRRIFERGLKKEDVLHVVETGEVIGEYPVHVVVAEDRDRETGYIVTAYTPDPVLWHNDFKTRRNP